MTSSKRGYKKSAIVLDLYPQDPKQEEDIVTYDRLKRGFCQPVIQHEYDSFVFNPRLPLYEQPYSYLSYSQRNQLETERQAEMKKLDNGIGEDGLFKMAKTISLIQSEKEKMDKINLQEIPTKDISSESSNFTISESECDMAKDNNLIGQLELTDIQPASKSIPQTVDTIDFATNYLLRAPTRDQLTGSTDKKEVQTGCRPIINNLHQSNGHSPHSVNGPNKPNSSQINGDSTSSEASNSSHQSKKRTTEEKLTLESSVENLETYDHLIHLKKLKLQAQLEVFQKQNRNLDLEHEVLLLQKERERLALAKEASANKM